MGNREFKDVLAELLESNGGTGGDNLLRISKLLRNIKPDFTEVYLQRLLRGLPPSEEDRKAISVVLEPPAKRWVSDFWEAEDDYSRRLAEIALRYTKSPLIAKELVDSFSAEVSYRNEMFNSSEAESVMAEIFANKKWNEELALFIGMT